MGMAVEEEEKGEKEYKVGSGGESSEWESWKRKPHCLLLLCRRL